MGPKGNEVIVKLLADGNPVAGQEVKLNEGNGWKGEFKNLPKYNDTGKIIKYTVTEAQVSGVDGNKYNSSIDGDAEHGLTIKNTNKETVKVPVKKTWVGPKGSEVVVKLLADGNPVDGQEVKLNEGNGWKGEFKNLPKYNDAGKIIKYTVTEAQVSGVDGDKYNSSIDGDVEHGFTITNTNKETVQIPVIKTWVGGEADKVVIRLLADGKEIASKELSKANGWKHTFKGLKKYNGEKLIVYTIKEDKVSGFKSKISGNAKDGFKVTNIKIHHKKPENHNQNRGGKRKTGDSRNMAVWVALLAISGVAVGELFRRRRVR